MILKNVSGQGIYLYAHDTAQDAPRTADAANITGQVSKDGAAATAFAAVHPVEIGGGLYWQPFSQAETNGNAIGMYWASATADTKIDPVAILTERGLFSGITSLAAWLRGLFRQSTMDATAKGEVNAGGGTYDEATDSLEALQWIVQRFRRTRFSRTAPGEGTLEVLSDDGDPVTIQACTDDGTTQTVGAPQ